MGRFQRGKGTSLMVVDTAEEQQAAASAAEFRQMRYRMPLHVIDDVQLAGAIASNRLLDMLANGDEYEKLAPNTKLKAIELAMTQAFGRSDSALQEEKMRVPEKSDSKQIMREHLMRLSDLVDLPEMRKDKE